MNGQKKELSLSLFFCLSGTMLRVVFAFMYTPWEHAPDQLAWEFLLNEGTFSYAQFIHYPHEGGTIPASVIARIFSFFTDFHPLTLTALLFDFAVRMTMLLVVSRVFHRNTFILFGIWTIFASPAIIPWSSVMFGLHSVAAVFPFIMIYLIANANRFRHFYLLSGFFLGCAVWFHYSNIILIPSFFFYLLISKKLNRKAFSACFMLSFILVMHLFVRLYADAGFHLNASELTSIRGTHFILNKESFRRLLEAWPGPLSDAAVLARDVVPDTTFLTWVWSVLAIAGLAGYFQYHAKQKTFPILAASLAIIFFFVIMYAVSPFYYDREEPGNYVAYRHLTYILPLISLVVITGLLELKFKAILAGIFLVVTLTASFSLFTIKGQNRKTVLEAGWVLAVKMGHQPEIVSRAVSVSGYDEALLLEGVGWGTTLALLQETAELNENQKHDRILFLLKILSGYPNHFKPFLMKGVETAFSESYSPRPDPDLLVQIQNEISIRMVKN